jgi:hypothetical protein
MYGHVHYCSLKIQSRLPSLHHWEKSFLEGEISQSSEEMMHDFIQALGRFPYILENLPCFCDSASIITTFSLLER